MEGRRGGLRPFAPRQRFLLSDARGFPSVEERQKSEDAFYGSEEWKQGPRAAVLAAIDSYTTIVIRVDDNTLRGLRMQNASAPASDLDTLVELNREYIRSVQTSDVERFKQILADDFLCSQPDGSLINRQRFLEQTAVPVTISNLEAHDVEVRLMGDVAIVHARTTYTAADGRAGRDGTPTSGRGGTAAGSRFPRMSPGSELV